MTALSKMGYRLLFFWLMFPLLLSTAGYQSGVKITADSIFAATIDIKNIPTSQEIFSRAPSNIFTDALRSIADTFLFFVSILSIVINLIFCILKFLVFYVETLTLAFSDINIVVRTVINVLQIFSFLYIISFIRGGSG